MKGEGKKKERRKREKKKFSSSFCSTKPATLTRTFLVIQYYHCSNNKIDTSEVTFTLGSFFSNCAFTNTEGFLCQQKEILYFTIKINKYIINKLK